MNIIIDIEMADAAYEQMATKFAKKHRIDADFSDELLNEIDHLIEKYSKAKRTIQILKGPNAGTGTGKG